MPGDPTLLRATAERPATPTVDGPRTVTKVMWRLIPFAIAIYVLNYLDRLNVSFAKLEMNRDLKLTDAIYGFGASVFFIGYFLFEVPSNLILQKVGARVWIARIMITWGAVSAAMMFVHGPTSFYVLRFLLGVSEAGLFPGVLLYSMSWIPAEQRGRAGAWFLTSIAIAGVIGAPVAGYLLEVHGLGLAGWQWLFLLEGIPTMILGFFVLWLMPNRPDDARWLTAAERDWLNDRIHAEQSSQHPESHLLKFALLDARVWLLSLLYGLILFAFYGLNYWIPSIIEQTSKSSTAIVGWLSAIPFFAATAGMIAIGYLADYTGRNRLLVALCSLLGAIGMLGCARSTSTAASVVCLSISAVGVFGTLAPFWALPPTFLRGSAAAVGIAIINSIGNLGGGFISPNVIGQLREKYHSYTNALLLSGVVLVVASGVAMGITLRRTEWKAKPAEAD